MLKVDRVNVFYNTLQVLWDLTFYVKKGELVTIIGANAAGKTTVIKTISGQVWPASGTVTFLDKRIDHLPPYEIVRLGIAQVPEGRKLFPGMTVLENLKLGAYTPESRRKLNDSLEWVYSIFPILKERKDQMAWTLSGGEQQMLAMARALMSRPKLYLLDEPSIGLAPIMVNKVFKIIKQLRDEGVTILLVEQNVAKALELADRGYVLETGRLILQGTGEELLKNEYVKKAYLGI